MARDEPLTLQSLSPDVVEAARAAAAASGLTLDEWLNRTILGIVGGFAAARNGERRAEQPEGRWADPLSSISQNLKTAADAASAAGVSFEQWLSQAILTNTTTVAQQGRSSEEPDLSLFRPVPPRPASARVVPIRAEVTLPTAVPAKASEVAPFKAPAIAPVAESKPTPVENATASTPATPPAPAGTTTAPAPAERTPPAPVRSAPPTSETEAKAATTAPEVASAAPPRAPERPMPALAKKTRTPPSAGETTAESIPELPSFPDVPTPEPFQPRVHTEIPDVVVAPPKVPTRPSPLFEPGYLNELAETPRGASVGQREPSFGPAKPEAPRTDKPEVAAQAAEPRLTPERDIPKLPSDAAGREAEDVSVPDAVLDKRLAQIIADARAEVAAMARNSAQAPQPPAAPIQPAVAGGPARAKPRSRGGPWLTVAALVILAVVAAAVWVLPKLPQLGVQFDKKPDYVQQLPAPGMARRDPAAVDKIETLPLTRPGESERPAAAKAETLPEPASQHVEVYRQAATAGSVKAQLALAQLYLRGDGVAKDAAEAARWYREAASKHNDANAQYALGVLLERGIGVDKDPIEALLWFQRAAQQGHPAALTNTGVAYSMGEVVPRDYAKAFSYFQRAADAGVAQAQFNLGLLYENGLGVERNPAMAYRWYSAAAAGGDPGATQAVERLTATLPADDLARAKDLLRQAAGKP